LSSRRDAAHTIPVKMPAETQTASEIPRLFARTDKSAPHQGHKYYRLVQGVNQVTLRRVAPHPRTLHSSQRHYFIEGRVFILEHAGAGPPFLGQIGHNMTLCYNYVIILGACHGNRNPNPY
jgi:hypothetical protein